MSDATLNKINQIWPLLLALSTFIAGYSTLKTTVDVNDVRLSALERRVDENARRADEAVQRLQLNVVRICAKLGADCKE